MKGKPLPIPDVGAKFGNWTVTQNGLRQGKKNKPACLCECKCGRSKIVSNESLIRGSSTSCGCSHCGKPSPKMIPPPEIGSRFGRWVVIDNTQRVGKRNAPASLCRCDCGTMRAVDNESLRSGHSNSCGCNRVTHGMTNTRLFRIWGKMKDRCLNPNHAYYPRYGGRGITVCPEWIHDFVAFREWALANGYDDSLTLDRIDNNKGYSPDNCRWATATEQQNNTHWNKNLTYRGKTMSVSMWAHALDMPVGTLFSRIYAGWDAEKAITTPVRISKSRRINNS